MTALSMKIAKSSESTWPDTRVCGVRDIGREAWKRRCERALQARLQQATMAVLHMTEAQVTSLFNYLQSDRPMEHARAIWTNIHKEASPLTTLLLSSSVRKLLAGRGVESFRGKRGT